MVRVKAWRVNLAGTIRPSLPEIREQGVRRRPASIPLVLPSDSTPSGLLPGAVFTRLFPAGLSRLTWVGVSQTTRARVRSTSGPAVRAAKCSGMRCGVRSATGWLEDSGERATKYPWMRCRDFEFAPAIYGLTTALQLGTDGATRTFQFGVSGPGRRVALRREGGRYPYCAEARASSPLCSISRSAIWKSPRS